MHVQSLILRKEKLLVTKNREAKYDEVRINCHNGVTQFWRNVKNGTVMVELARSGDAAQLVKIVISSIRRCASLCNPFPLHHQSTHTGSSSRIPQEFLDVGCARVGPGAIAVNSFVL